MSSSFTFLLYSIFLSILISSGVFAAISPIRSEILFPIDTLQQKLSHKQHSLPAQTLKKAYLAFQKNQFSLAIELASKIPLNGIFSDYRFWISAESYRGQAKNFLARKNYLGTLSAAQKAAAFSLQIENKNPYSPFLKNISRDIGQAELLIGSAYCGTSKWKKSEQTFEKAFQRLQTQNLLILVQPNHLEQYARACKKQDDSLCMGWLQKFSSIFSKKTEESKAILKYFPDLPDLNKGVKVFTKATRGYKAPDLDQVAFDISMQLYFEEKYSQAIKSFQKFTEDFPRSAYRFRVQYWLGQTLSQQKEAEQAEKIYQLLLQESPLTYYGLLASHAMSKPIDSVIQADLPLASDFDISLLPHETYHLERAEAFLTEKSYDLAAFELKMIKVREGLSSPFLVYLSMLNDKARNYQNNFQLMGELIQRGYEGIFSSYSLRMIFPTHFLDLIKKHSLASNLDPILVLSLIKQESAFEEEANSSVGAIGLMQLMPMTARETDATVNLSHLLNADINIAIGTKYLKKLLIRFKGNIVYALAGYNAGPNAVDRWIKDSPPRRGMLEFIESIPYRETREYVASIIRNYYWYCRQLNGISFQNFSYFWNVYGPPELPLPLPEEKPSLQKAPSLKQQNGSGEYLHL